MIARPSCDFCSLIVLGCKQIWRGEWTGKTETKCSLNEVTGSRRLEGGYGLQVSAWHVGRPFQWVEFEVVLRRDGEVRPVARAFDIYPKVDFARLKKMFEICEESHEECTVVRETPDKMRVIDLESLNIVDAPLRCRYCALSYVWGKPSARWLTLIRENTNSLQKPNSLLDGNLPLTIRDAIQACKELGERYLWVDSLCIVQDDPVQQKQQIDIMDLIYTSATITLVAAAGDRADTGLPGVSTRRREVTRQTITIQDMDVSNLLPRLKNTVDVSVWNTRGWTYQERLFSQRCLFFTESQAYYACSHGVEYEKVDRLLRAHWNAERFKGTSIPRTFMEIYSKNVTDYTSRSLTSQSDIIRAFQGVLNDMSRLHNQTFHAGLPEGKFEESLMWQRIGPSTVGDLLQVAPSWSWASAGSPIKYTITEERIHLSQTPLPAFWQDGQAPLQFSITWLLNLNGSLVTLKTDLPEVNPSDATLSSSEKLPEEVHSLALQKHCRLLFTTQHARMNLQNSVPYTWRDTWWTDYITDVNSADVSILSILVPGAETDNLAGFIEMDKQWAEKSLDEPHTWEFLAISLATSKNSDFMHHHLTQQRNVKAPLVWSRNVRQLVVHAMLVERDHGVTRRLGVGKVFLDMWERAAPQMSWVVLE
jgi:hypothetical protein